MSPEVLASRIEQMTPQQLAAVDRALTPEAIQALLMLMPELEPILSQFAQQAGAGAPQDAAQAPTQTAQADPQAVQTFMRMVGAA